MWPYTEEENDQLSGRLYRRPFFNKMLAKKT